MAHCPPSPTLLSQWVDRVRALFRTALGRRAEQPDSHSTACGTPDPAQGHEPEESPREPPAALRASLADHYRLEREIGRGGMATVYLAEDLKHHREVAIKVLHPDLSATIRAERFLREIEIAARLNHPHISPLFDSGEADGFLYYVMPLMQGKSLRRLLAREGRLPVARAVSIARDVADALGYAHDLGVVHRDVKPANILLAGDHAMLADFGVARAVEAAGEDLTTTGLTPGTPLYMSPEQLSGETEADARSDLYSLGCVLYEMLAGRRPFAGSAMQVLAGHVKGRPPSVDAARRDVPPALASVLRRTLATEPESRYQTASEFLEALTATRTPRVSSRTRGVAAALMVAGLALAGVAGLPRLGGSADLTDRAGSVVVLPFADAIQSSEEYTLVLDLADELTRQLNRWDSVRAVPQVALAGVAFDLDVESPVLKALDDGRRIARALGVETLITLNVRVRGDSAEVTATVFDPGSRSPRGRPWESKGSKADPFRLAAGISHDLLGLTGPVEAIENLRRQSSNAQALLLYAEGLRLLARWRLTEAEAALRRATDLDSTFAMAHHYLAVDLYWQAAGERSGLMRLGPEATRLSRAALRHANALPSRERDHVVAFNRFLEGDYQAARQGYGDLLARDSTDVYAWLLAGIVEFADPWLELRGDGSLRPRADWNAALRSFSETTRLSPDFHLGYGHLFDITEVVLRNAEAETGAGRGLYRPRSELVPPWESLLDPRTQEAFYLVQGDSLVWLAASEFEMARPSDVDEGAVRVLERSMRTLRRWAAYAPEEARPHAELARWTLRQRSLLEAPQPPQRLDSLALAAREHAERALSLTRDTLTADLVRLANLHLATGEHERARALVEEAIGLRTDLVPPRSAANVFLHDGRWRTALELLEREQVARRFLLDPQTGALLGDDGGVERVIRRLEVLGVTGVEGATLDRAFRDLEDLWARAPAGTAPIPALRTHQAPRIAAALASVPAVLARWRTEADLGGPFWKALDPADAEGATSLRAAAAAVEPGPTEPADPVRSFLLGKVALKVGDPALALRLLARLDSIPLSVDARDPGWGLMALALFHRGEAYRAMGDRASAAVSFQAFLATRPPGEESAPYQTAARARLARLREGA